MATTEAERGAVGRWRVAKGYCIREREGEREDLL